MLPRKYVEIGKGVWLSVCYSDLQYDLMFTKVECRLRQLYDSLIRTFSDLGKMTSTYDPIVSAYHCLSSQSMTEEE